jgi:UDP-4-amino-4,6-dideoxy-N-acetyl-beta-L-altrosamine N-acetyltransferase
MIYLKDYTKLTNQEHKNILELRNKEYVRKVSLTQEKITFENHLQWVEKLKTDFSNEYYAIFEDEKLLGAINIINKDTQIKWGVFFKQTASLVIKSIVPLYFLDYMFKKFNPLYIYLDVKKDNQNAISFDKNLGFSICNEVENIVTMRMNKQQFEDAKKSIFLKRVVKKIEKYEFCMERR